VGGKGESEQRDGDWGGLAFQRSGLHLPIVDF